MNDPDNRKETRVSISLPVTGKVASCPSLPEIEGAYFNCNLVDISSNGLRLNTRLLIPDDTYMEIAIEGPVSTVQVSGHVKWSRVDPGGRFEGGCSLEFRDPADRKLLSEFITTLKERTCEKPGD